jgi:hypothetical protein
MEDMGHLDDESEPNVEMQDNQKEKKHHESWSVLGPLCWCPFKPKVYILKVYLNKV